MIGRAIRGGLGLVAVGAGIISYGQVTANADETTRDATGAIVESGGVGAFRLQVGDCFNTPGATEDPTDTFEVQSVEGVPCTESHDSEVFALFDLAGGPDAPYPGDQAAFDAGAVGCLDRFSGYVGESYEASTRWDATLFYPSQGSWDDADDREVVCIVVPLDGSPVTVSARAGAAAS